MNLQIEEQEVTGNYLFDSQIYITSNFQRRFGIETTAIVRRSVEMILEIVRTVGADYLQVLHYNGIKYYVIDDVDHITFLLPEDY